MVHGHTVVRLPEHRALIDTSVEQFAMVAEVGGGPVITTGTLTSDMRLEQVRTRRGKLRLTYTLAPALRTAVLLDHPVVADADLRHRRHGLNLASAAIIMLAERLSADRARMIPHRRTAARIDVVRGAQHQQAPAGDWRFCLPGPNGEPVDLRLAELPLPDDTLPAIRFEQ